jgi:hypothetical protein
MVKRTEIGVRRMGGTLAIWFLAAGAATFAEDGPIRRLTLDETAAVIPLFEGLEQGTLRARVVLRDEFGGHVQLTNTTNQPQTVALPPAVAAVQVLKQFQPGVFGDPLTPGGQGNQAGGAQAVGGPTNGIGQQGIPGGLQNQFPGNNFFSIPPEKTVQFDFHTVCLEHGKPTPTSAKQYVLRPIEKQSSDPALQELLAQYDPQRDDRHAVQAAAWHLADGMNWEELARKTERRLGGLPPTATFTSKQLQQARKLVETAQKNAPAAPTGATVAERKKI